MSTKASAPTQDLPALDFVRIAFIPVGDAQELPPLVGWAQWDRAVAELDQATERPEFSSRRAAIHFLR